VLSFVVPAHEEEALVGAAVRSIHDAARPLGERYEVIVVDDASTAARAGARVVPVALRQISAVRNAGAAVALGDALFFVDADTRVNEAVVRAAAAALAEGAVGGGATVRFDGPLPRHVAWFLRPAMWCYHRFRLAAGCFLFSSRAAFEAAGGFDASIFAGEEVELSRALGRRGRFVILDEWVVTSARKLRTHSTRELLGTLAKLAVLGRRGVRDRRRLDVWYAPRRPDPGAPAADEEPALSEP